jgi:hypothetical protein
LDWLKDPLTNSNRCDTIKTQRTKEITKMMKVMYRDDLDFYFDYTEITLEQLEEIRYNSSSNGEVVLDEIDFEANTMYFSLDYFD